MTVNWHAFVVIRPERSNVAAIAHQGGFQPCQNVLSQATSVLRGLMLIDIGLLVGCVC